MYNQAVSPFTGSANADPSNQLVRSNYQQHQQQLISDPTSQFFMHAFNATTQLAQCSHELTKHQTEELNKNNIRHVEDWKAQVAVLEKRIEMKDITITKLLKAVTILETEKNHVNDKLSILVEHIKKEPEVARKINTNKSYKGYNNNGYTRNKFNTNASDYVPRYNRGAEQSTSSVEQPTYLQAPTNTVPVQAFDFPTPSTHMTESQKIQSDADELIASLGL